VGQARASAIAAEPSGMPPPCSPVAFTEGSIGLALRWKEDGVLDRATELSAKLQKILLLA